jgi:hypothetical protein
MFTSLTQLWTALRRLADNVHALGTTVAEVNDGLRQRLALDGQETPLLPHQAVQDATNGHDEERGPAGKRARQKASQTV